MTTDSPKSASKAKPKSRQAKLAPSEQWLKHLVAAADDDDVGVALQVALGNNSRAAEADQADGHFEFAGNAEWSELAVLRSSWRRYSPRIIVDYGQPSMQMEISAGQHLLFGGAVGCELAIDGKPLPMSSSWTCVCWQSDSDCDYLELESHPTPGVLLQRSIMLAHEDCFAWIADSISSGRAGELNYRLSLPAAAGLDCKFSSEHTEAELNAKKSSLARVLPLALPEWRSSARDGKLAFEDGNLVLQQRQQGWGLYAGVFIDLESSRLQRPFTWRQLTVAENREILSRDLAVAQRVQIGDNHWVFYRSVGAIGNRTFLGINVATELLAARFETDGEYETLVEVQ